VTQSNNTNFLPASAPSSHAAQLTAPFGTANLQPIALSIALGILMDTFLVRPLLVPSTVVLLGRWNWWPSRMSRPGTGGPDQADRAGRGDAAPGPTAAAAGTAGLPIGATEP
jgi:uncharacterized membrane protein YdfJ with MMPL/SSD domain